MTSCKELLDEILPQGKPNADRYTGGANGMKLIHKDWNEYTGEIRPGLPRYL